MDTIWNGDVDDGDVNGDIYDFGDEFGNCVWAGVTNLIRYILRSAKYLSQRLASGETLWEIKCVVNHFDLWKRLRWNSSSDGDGAFLFVEPK